MVLSFTRFANYEPTRSEVVDFFKNDSRTKGKELIRYHVEQSELRHSEPMTWEDWNKPHFRRFTIFAEFN